MHGEIHYARQQRPLDFLRKDPARANLFDRPCVLDVAAR
jgi:hypothetical protein